MSNRRAQPIFNSQFSIFNFLSRLARFLLTLQRYDIPIAVHEFLATFFNFYVYFPHFLSFTFNTTTQS